MKLMGINVDKKIEGGCILDFCIDDEMSWIVVRPRANNDFPDNDDKICLYENMNIGCIVCQLGTFGGKIQEINYNEKFIKINDEIIYEDTDVHAIGIIGEDRRPNLSE